MADKKISDLAASTGSLGSNQYIELYDSAEALPVDQNKKRAIDSLKTEFGAHTVNQDTYLDKDNANEVTAAQLKGLLERAGSVPFTYTYDASLTTGDPGAGNIRLGNAALNSITNLHISYTDKTSVDIEDILALLVVDSHFYMQDMDDNTQGGLYKVASITDNTTYYTYSVTTISGVGGVMTDGTKVAFSFIPKSTPGSGDVATDTIWDAKGDLAVGTGANTSQKLTAGANGQIVTYDSGETTGAKVTNFLYEFGVQVGDKDEDLATGAQTGATFRPPVGFVVTEVSASVTTAPTGSTLVFDINEDGTSILSTKLSIDAGEKTSRSAATAPVISDANIAADAEVGIDIDQVGSTVAGTNATIFIKGYTRDI